jgi:hypothetical protein
MCLVILTYKRKLLLKRRDNCSPTANENQWTFFGNSDGKREISKSSLMREMENEMHISISLANLITEKDNAMFNNWYVAGLTDKDVNEIKRRDGQELEFYSIREVEKLSLADSSKMLFSEQKALIEASFLN